MTTNPEAAPMTAEEFRARIGEIAPLDFEGTAPVGAQDLARFMALQAQRRWTRNLSDYFEGPPGMPAFHESIGTMCSEFAALHLLMALIEADPVKAGELATQIRDAWDDGQMIGERLYEHGQALGIDHAEVDRLEYAWQALPGVQAAREAHRPGDLTARERDLIHADLGQLLEALGLGDYARPESSHEVMQQCTALVVKYREGAGSLARTLDGQTRAMEAARIEMRQNGPHAAMQWILNSLPDVWDNPDTAWNGSESAQEWFDRAESAYRVPEPAAVPLRAPERIPLDIALAALRSLASASPVAVNGAPEADARKRLAARAVEDVKAVTREAGDPS